jgi:hypothetical protein
LGFKCNAKKKAMIEFILSIKARNETLFYFGAINLFLAILFLVLSKTTTIEVSGVNAWYKPLKFSLSIFIYSCTMAWYCYYLPSFNINLFNWSIIALFGFEIIYIAFQAAKGEMSHYNSSTPVYSFLFSMMAFAASAATIYTAYIGVLFFKNHFLELPEYYVWAIRLGIVLFVIFSFQGFLMGSRLSHTVGSADGAVGIPILGWSTQYGDLRIAHFVGMHALQVLPLLSFYLLKNTKAVVLVSLLYALLAVYTLVLSLQGRSLVSV